MKTPATSLTLGDAQGAHTGNPGTYCGGITINGGSVTSAAGTYIITSGNVAIGGTCLRKRHSRGDPLRTQAI